MEEKDGGKEMTVTTITLNPTQSQKLYEKIIDTTEKHDSLQIKGALFDSKEQLDQVHEIISINRAKVLGTILKLEVDNGRVLDIDSESVKIKPNKIVRRNEHIFK